MVLHQIKVVKVEIKAAKERIYVDVGFWGGLVPENAFNASAHEALLNAGVLGLKSFIRSNLQYAALSALRRLPLDPGNPAFLHHAAQGVSFADPVAVRHSLEILSKLALRDPYAVAMALGKLAQPGGALQDVLHLHDVLPRVSLARLCHTIARVGALDERPDIKSQFNSVLYQLLLDPSERVCFEAILCVLGKSDNTERTKERAAGWYRSTQEILKLPEAPSVSSKEASKEKSEKAKRPQPLIKLVMTRSESSFRSFSRPVLHMAVRVVQEMGKSWAAAFAVGLQDIDEGAHVNSFAETANSHDSDTNENSHSEGQMREKKTKLKSPNFHISKTRLIMYNIPKSMTEKKLKKLCIDAVTSRATEQTPVIKQFLKDVKKGKVVTKIHSRGVAFVEFTEHQHALVALRVLNNNPETFGPEYRPIVEFALNNIQTLKLRNAKIHAQQHGIRDDQNDVKQGDDAHLDKQNSKKRTSRGDDGSVKDSVSNKEENHVFNRATSEGHGSAKKQKGNPASAKAKEFPSKEKPDGLQMEVQR